MKDLRPVEPEPLGWVVEARKMIAVSGVDLFFNDSMCARTFGAMIVWKLYNDSSRVIYESDGL